ncbi:unnamed protein product [Prorocentrum cordatum]|uniref:Uncharacterized protein n=1 Tax=Prorocentrum cordatum TaxID=2364126 RepID=A0ABN9PHN7_9DINO|nr:unnamed protein product [Polarella glacialis]
MSLQRNMALLRRSEQSGSLASSAPSSESASAFDRMWSAPRSRAPMTEEELAALWPAPEPDAAREAAPPLLPEAAAPAGEPSGWAGAAVRALRARLPRAGP